MAIEIRVASILDIEGLIKLADDLIQIDDLSGRELMLEKTICEPNHWIYVAEVDKQIVGFVDFQVFSDCAR